MPFCSTGVSAQKAGAADQIILTTAILEALATRYGLAWLTSPFIGAAGSSLQLHLPTFCALDPPDDPGLTGTDLVFLLSPAPTVEKTIAQGKVNQLLSRYAWFDFCECASVTTPAPPTPPTQPTGTPAVNPPPTGYPVSAPCLTVTRDAVEGITEAGGYTHNSFNLPPGATTFSALLSTTAVDGFLQMDMRVQFFDANDDAIFENEIAVTVDPDSPVTVQGPIPITAVSADLSGTPTPDDVGTIDFAAVNQNVYCYNATPGGYNSPCCPPDPILESKLDTLLQLVTLIQRQVAPFAYVSGAVHSGLTGTGTISVQSLLGVLLNTSIPDRAGEVAGTPVTVFDCGWLNLATADGYTERFFVASDSQIILPRLPGIYTAIGYTFQEGVSVTITELMREP